MSDTIEVRMRKANDCFVVILVACAILIYVFLVLAIDIVRYRIRIGTQLYRAKGNSRAGISVSHPRCTDHRVDVLNQLRFCLETTGRQTCQ